MTPDDSSPVLHDSCDSSQEASPLTGDNEPPVPLGLHHMVPRVGKPNSRLKIITLELQPVLSPILYVKLQTAVPGLVVGAVLGDPEALHDRAGVVVVGDYEDGH